MMRVPVTERQYGQLEVAWMLCAWPGKRKLVGAAVQDWREAQQHILGFVPEGDWTPELQREGGSE